MDTIKFALVIVLPENATFGYLIIASYATVICGAIFFVVYVIRNGNLKSWTNYNPS